MGQRHKETPEKDVLCDTDVLKIKEWQKTEYYKKHTHKQLAKIRH